MKSHHEVKIEIQSEQSAAKNQLIKLLEKLPDSSSKDSKSLTNIIAFALNNDLAEFAYSKLKKPMQMYQPEVVTEASLTCFFVYSQLCFQVYAKNTRNQNLLWLSYMLLQHCLMNRNIYDISNSNERYITDFETNLKSTYFPQRMRQATATPKNRLKEPTEKTPLKSTAVVISGLKDKIKVTNSPFSMLPKDMILLIMSHLSIKDLVNLSEVDKYFKDLTNEKILWDHFEMTEVVKDVRFINKCKEKIDTNYFECTAKERIRDFYAVPHYLDLNLDKKIDELLDKNPKTKAVYDNFGGGIVCLCLLLGLAAGGYVGYLKAESDTDNDAINRFIKAFFAAFAVSLMTCGVETCAIGLLYCLYLICCQGGSLGVEKAANRLEDFRIQRFRVKDSKFDPTLYVPLPSNDASINSENSPELNAQASINTQKHH